MLPATIPTTRLPQFAVEQACAHAERIRPFARIASPLMTTACRQAGLPIGLAELCGAVLASLVDDLVTASKLPRTNFERAKRLERVIACTQEPIVNALRIAMAASPINGRACARHWDAICDKAERGRLAWLLGLETDNAQRYSRKIEKMQN